MTNFAPGKAEISEIESGFCCSDGILFHRVRREITEAVEYLQASNTYDKGEYAISGIKTKA